MRTGFTLQFLQDQIGADYVEENPITGKPRIIQGLNEVWQTINEHGGVARVARLFGLSEADVWGWVDSHWVPELYAPYLADPRGGIAEMQLSSVGCEDPETGDCWPRSWKLDAADFDLNRQSS